MARRDVRNVSTKDLQANSNALRVCPFCGGEAELVSNDIGVFVGCFHDNCPIGPQTSTYLDGYATEAEAIAAWNTRADYHGYEQAAIEAWESIKAWNARAERTCRNDKDKWSGLAKYLFVCSECGWNLADVGNDAIDISARLMKRCPMCGAKVVGK